MILFHPRMTALQVREFCERHHATVNAFFVRGFLYVSAVLL